jgi:SAM-dependent methyltransferase
LALADQIISILKKSPADQYSLYRQLSGTNMSQITKAIAELQIKKIIHVVKYRKSERTGLDVPVYSLSQNQRGRLDVHGLLAGVTSERLVEYDFVTRSLISRSKRANILDIGAAESGLVKTIREYGKGWQVIGIDLVPGADAMMDARLTGFRDGTFDQVISISTIEHIGANSNDKGDMKVMQEIWRILKKGGMAIVTVPYGQSEKHDYRVYDLKSLAKLVHFFRVVKKEFYRYNAGKWLKCSQESAHMADLQVPQHLHSAACACLLLRKQ